ncbi:hypothetical protein RRG08_005493 [Elysia crispata]|uniref:Uncharacterized protein n=1 Tax=Elysia crispata TaxID=231223 RepID=A0AAE0Y129_9GAST|nr:hypothetical protein RRG08_005493 [Elysia crispata]
MQIDVWEIWEVVRGNMGSRQRKYGKSSEEIWEVVRGNMGSRQRKYGKSSEEIWEVVRGNMGSGQRKYGKSSEEIWEVVRGNMQMSYVIFAFRPDSTQKFKTCTSCNLNCLGKR